MTAPKRRPPYRAEHVGSLLRPDELRDAVLGQTKLPQEQLDKLADQAIKDVVNKQLDLGFHAPTDGEYRRALFLLGFHDKVQGFEEVEGLEQSRFRTYMSDIADFIDRGEGIPYKLICTGKIKHVKPIYLDEYKFLRAQAPSGEQVKVTIISPLWYYQVFRSGQAYLDSAYSSDEEYLADLAVAYRAELDVLYENGCRNIQIDDPYLTAYCDERVARGFAADGMSILVLLERYIEFYNKVLADRPDDFHIGIHLCRGNYIGSRHFSQGSYESIASTVLARLDVDTFYLEYDNDRSGGFEPLRHVPPHTNVILGVVSSKFPELEDVALLKSRVLEAAEKTASGAGQTRDQALQRMGVSPQCGFASHAKGNAVTMEDMFKKLSLVRRLADEIWPGEP
ncbi:Hypothetical protein D9617_17g047710 [Elsinoe fawcettii]|nr:Hypothetical protein D9617_17g047710 [Elsinoe fawcettii]